MADNYYPIEFTVGGSSFTVFNSGTAPTPCVFTFIPKVDFFRLTIEGLSEEPISITGIRANDVVVIDGENREVLINDQDAFDSYDAWEFPKLQPGENIVTIANGNQASIQIEYNPRYM